MLYIAVGFISMIAGAAVCGLMVRWQLRARLMLLEERLRVKEDESEAAQGLNTRLQQENEVLRRQQAVQEERMAVQQQATAEKMETLEHAREALTDSFKALASDALQAGSQSLLEQSRLVFEKMQQGALSDLTERQRSIDELVRPMKDALGRVDEKMEKQELARGEAYGALLAQVSSMQEAHKELRSETQRLVQALHRPAVRGRWGEIQLRRVVELAGMTAYCDFEEQVSMRSDAGGLLRPDLLVRLPGKKCIVVDSKMALEAYLRGLETDDETERKRLMSEHARQVRRHLQQLGSKSYWEHLPETPEFVVMFIPGESFFSAALEQDPTLIEQGVDLGVIPASPTTLIALLRSVAYGWKQERLTENAEQIRKAGQELYERVAVFAEHLQKVGRGLDSSVQAYNRAVGSLESRVLVSARRINELGAGSSRALVEGGVIEKQVKELDTGMFDKERA